MHWIERLNQNPGRLTLGQGTAEIFAWAHREHLPDNLPHRHTHFEVCLVGRHGLGVFTTQGREWSLTPGTAFFARPGVIHQIQNVPRPAAKCPEMELYWVSFQWTPGQEGGAEVDALMRAFAESSVVAAPDREGRLGACWQVLQTLAGGEALAGFNLQATGLMTALLLTAAQIGAGADAPLFTESKAGGTPHDSTVRQAMRYIHDNLGKPLTLAEVAAQSHISARNLSRIFARFAGTSMIAYVTQARLERAQTLLRHTATPIKEVAALVGYDDVHHFTRVFARKIGCPPGAYRLGQIVSVPIIHKDGALV